MTSASKLIQASAGNAAGAGLAVEDVFSTYLYDGTGSAQTITNGVDLENEGGLVWIKQRSGAGNHLLQDTERGITNILYSNDDAAQTDFNYVTVNDDGFDLVSGGSQNSLFDTFVSWTFRKAPKFFDVVTYTGDGVAGRTVSHNLGSVPGCIIVKNTTNTNGRAWYILHRSLNATTYLQFDTDASASGGSLIWNDTEPTDSVFTVGSGSAVNGSGDTMVAYLFAHNDGDGEFGKTADQDIIKCGSFTVGGTGTSVPVNEIDLGFEAQWVLYKRTDSINAANSEWRLADIMRGMPVEDNYQKLEANNNSAEAAAVPEYLYPTASGFNAFFPGNASFPGAGASYIYIAIRRGPMKTPESGTEVFDATVALGSTGTTRAISFPSDLALFRGYQTGDSMQVNDRLRGFANTSTANVATLSTTSNAAEASSAPYLYDVWNTSFKDGDTANNLQTIWYNFRRAPGFFDVVAYEGGGTEGRTVPHNLGVVPELVIIKNRSGTGNWNTAQTNVPTMSFLNATTQGLPGSLPFTLGNSSSYIAPTDSNLTVASGSNASSTNYIAYLFATLPGVSKVGSYTGNGSSQTIDCGFSTGARFVLTKRTNSTGNWNVWDSERGIVGGNDPRLELNTTDAEDTGHDYIDPDSSGFIVNYVADDDDDSNVNGDEYIFLAIA